LGAPAVINLDNFTATGSEEAKKHPHLNALPLRRSPHGTAVLQLTMLNPVEHSAEYATFLNEFEPLVPSLAAYPSCNYGATIVRRCRSISTR
jgi:hypothetical protein